MPDMRIDAMLLTTAARLQVVPRSTPFMEAAKLFGAGKLRILVVCTDDGRAVGVLTRTDVLRHFGASPDANRDTVYDLMTSPIVSTRAEDDLLTTWQMMAERGLNHLPVLEHQGRPMGVLTLEDALKTLLQDERYEEHLLADYVSGIGYR
jgi:CBS domain-containing protein